MLAQALGHAHATTAATCGWLTRTAVKTACGWAVGTEDAAHGEQAPFQRRTRMTGVEAQAARQRRQHERQDAGRRPLADGELVDQRNRLPRERQTTQADAQLVERVPLDALLVERPQAHRRARRGVVPDRDLRIEDDLPARGDGPAGRCPPRTLARRCDSAPCRIPAASRCLARKLMLPPMRKSTSTGLAERGPAVHPADELPDAVDVADPIGVGTPASVPFRPTC